RLPSVFLADARAARSAEDGALQGVEEYADCEPVVHILDFIAADSDRALSSPTRGQKG
ncbi:acyl-[acyl-carrier-protein]--UDP-N-acetylglucosamine O-acyltransferase, partial [Rhizobium ruizarguesonis]